MKTRKYISYLLITLSIIIMLSANWVMNYFNNPTFDQLIYHVYTSVGGTDMGIILNYVKLCLLVPFIIIILLFIFRKKINTILKNKKISVCFLIISIIIFGGSSYYSLNHIGTIEYLKNHNIDSKFIEENYVDPKDVNIEFPKKLRNLVVIYIESMESSFTSTKEGGLFENNYIPKLNKLAKENISFSNSENLGGTSPIYGTGWTTAGLVSTIAGIPIKSPFVNDAINDNPFTYPKITSLAEILEDQGYKEKLILGSEASFGGINDFFQNHGNFEIFDVKTARETGFLTKENESAWGINDKDLFEYAKKDLTEISESKEPFYYNIITIDTHAPNGNVTSECPISYKNDYANAVNCSDLHVSEFISWLTKQEFYKNTTIVVMGDHLSMNGDFFNKVDSSKRRIYNAFINSAVDTKNTKNREFYQMDYFPTILASLGVKIEGNRLAMGTNLFSDEKTLMEKYGYETVNSELSKYSKFYNNNILY